MAMLADGVMIAVSKGEDYNDGGTIRGDSVNQMVDAAGKLELPPPPRCPWPGVDIARTTSAVVAATTPTTTSATGRESSVRAALAFIPPDSLFPKINVLREKHDKAFERWMVSQEVSLVI